MSYPRPGESTCIAEVCGYHAKAIQLAVSPVAQYRNFSFAARLAELKAHDNRILAIDEYVGNTDGVARSFDLSYTQLPDEAKLVLRRLGIAPVPVVSPEAATALTGLPLNEVTNYLHLLADAALIDRNREGYQIHDLVRDYARGLAASDSPGESRAAINRLLAYYQAAAAYADRLLTRQPPPAAIEPPAPSVRHDFAGPPSVIEWVRAELPNLLACVDYVVHNAEDNNRREEIAWVVLFAGALAGILRNESLWRRSIELQTRTVAVAEKIQVPLAVDRGEAARSLNEALEISTEIGNHSARIDALDGLGELSMLAGDPDAALVTWSDALKIAREHGMEREGASLAAKVGHVRQGSSFKLRRLAGRIGFLRRWNR